MSADYTANTQKIKTYETHELEKRVNLIFKLVGGEKRGRKRSPKTMMEGTWTERRKEHGESRQNLRRDNKELCYKEREVTYVQNLSAWQSIFFITVLEIELLLKNKHKRKQKQNPESFPCYSVFNFKNSFPVN